MDQVEFAADIQSHAAVMTASKLKCWQKQSITSLEVQTVTQEASCSGCSF